MKPLIYGDWSSLDPGTYNIGVMDEDLPDKQALILASVTSVSIDYRSGPDWVPIPVVLVGEGEDRFLRLTVPQALWGTHQTIRVVTNVGTFQVVWSF